MLYSAKGISYPLPDKHFTSTHVLFPLFSIGVLSFASIILWMSLLTVVSTAKVNLIQRINYGVMFEQQGSLISGSEYWIHTFQIPLPSKQGNVEFTQCDIVHQHCFILNQVISQLSAIRTQVSFNINQTVDMVHKLVGHVSLDTPSKTETRLRRGLFDFIGSISKSLFGTATVQDVNRLAKHVNILIHRNNEFAKDLAHHDELLSSYMSKTNQRFDNIISGIQNNYEGIQNLTQETAKFISHFEKISIHLSGFLIKQMNETAELNKYLEELKIAVHELVKGRLSPFLISPNMLKRTLQHIQSILNEKFTGFYLSNSSAHHKNLFVSIKFPMSTFQTPLTLYKIKTYPVPINSSSNHATQVINLPQYLAISNDNRQFAELTQDFVQTCSGKETRYCIKSFPLLSSVSPSCSLAIFYNDKETASTLCLQLSLHHKHHLTNNHRINT